MHCALTVFFSGTTFEDPPLNKELYLSSYHILAEEVTALGAQFSFVRGQNTYRGANRFSGGWRFLDHQFTFDPGIIDADIIYNKGEIFEYDADATVINNNQMDALGRNKRRTYEAMPDLFPVTCIVASQKELQAALGDIPSDIVVVKPLEGWGGAGIWIGPKHDVAVHVPSFPCLLQEYIDTSGGIPGITDEHHDFRLILFNDKPVIALLRTPKEGSLLANVAQGGSIRQVSLGDIPPDVLLLKDKVDAYTSIFGKRIYSMDCARDIHGPWKLIELNPQPGLVSLPDEKERRDYLKQLSCFLLDDE